MALLPLLHGLDRCSLPKRFLRNMVIVQMPVSLGHRLQILSGVEAVGGEYLADPAVESLDHAVGLRVAHR